MVASATRQILALRDVKARRPVFQVHPLWCHRSVYLIKCRKCNKQYVGETENALHIRLNGHRSNVKTKKMEKPVAAHFNLPGHSMEDLTIVVIEKIWKEDVQLR